VRHPDGTVVPQLINAAPLYDVEGEQTGAVVIFIDATEQREAQEALREAEAQQRAILETAPVGIAITKIPDNTVLYVNPEFTNILGYEGGKLLDKTVPDFYYDLEEAQRSLELLQAQGGVLEDYEVHARRADGTPLWLSLSIKPIMYDDQPASLAAFVDITDRMQAQAEIERNRRLLQEFLDNFPDLAFAKDPEGRIILANQALREFFPTPDGELVGKTVYDLVSEDVADGIWQTELRVLEQGEALEFEEVVPQQGELHTKLTTKFPLYDAEGNVSALGGVSIDITERKRAEIERERFTTRLDTAAAISEQIGTILDPDELLETVIPLIKERFGLYYVHVYTLDEDEGVLNLRAGYGEAGEQMLAEGHSIPLDREASLVATAARTQEPVLVDDVTENPNFMPNPLLPDTKTEVAVPAIAGGRVLGVFDVQHDEAHYFTQADLDVFQTLAAQIANAFRSAELYETAENERAFYDGIIENLPVGVWAVDNAFTPLLVNPAGRAMMGREVKDQDGGAYVENYEVINVETGELYDNAELPLVKAVTQGGTHTAVDAGVRHPDGTVVPQLINAAPLYDVEGEQTGAVVIFADATEQRKAQEALRESRERFQLVADYTYDWEYWISPEGDFIYNSPACETITGYTREAFNADPQLLVEIAHPEDRDTVEKLMNAWLTSEEPIELDFRIFTKTGELRWIGHASQAVYNSEGDFLGRRASNRDATEAKRAEMERARFTTQLNTAATISEQVGSILDPDELLETVIPLIKEQFGLYYVHVYTMDEDEGVLNLRAGYGEAGEKMLAEGHSIPLDREASLVATAARTKEPVLVDDVTENPNFMPNPLLPDTRTEVAVPAIAGGRVLGVFDVQHDEDHYFTDADLDVFQTLAAQIANAFRSAEIVETLNLTQFAVDHGPAAIYLMRQDGTLYDVNETACQMLGYTREELLSMDSFTDLDPNFPPEAWAVHWEELKEQREMTIQTQHRAKDGRLIPVEVEVNYLKYGDLELDCGFARDITDRLEAERAVRESEERLRLLIEGVQDYAVVMLDTEGYVVGWNEGAQRIKGYTEDEIIGEHFSRFYTDEDREIGHPQEMLELAREHGSHEDTGLRVRKDGSTFWADVVMTAIRDDEGNLRGYSKLTRDITERREREAALRDSEQRFRGLYESSPLGIILNDFESGDYLEANEAFLEMMGYTLDELNALSYWDLTPETYAEQEDAQIRSMEETGKYGPYEKEYIKSDGTVFPVVLNGVLIEGNEGRKLIWSTVEDITERVAAEAERERLATIISNASDFIGYLDMDANAAAYVNTAGWQMMGHTQMEDVIGQPITHFHPPEDVARMQESIIPTVLEEGEWRGENHLLRVDGSVIPVDQTLFLIRDEQHDRQLLATFMTDITERLAAERQRERFTTQLSTAAEIAQRVGAILDTDELLQTVIPLLKDRFGLYHAHVYVLDEENQALRLRTGYGNVGEIMRRQGHKIMLDNERSLVARAARTQDVVVSNDVTQDPDFMPNLLLPETQAEVAVPFMIGDQVLGVFDVQADEADFFTDADLNVFRTLAGQIANAFQSARLFEQQRAAETAQRDAAERIRAIFEAMTEGITVTNTLGQIEDVNEATLRLHGYEARDELLGRSQMELFARTNWSQASRGIREALETGRSETAEYVMQRNDGSTFDAEQSSALLRDSEGSPAGFVSITRDITERKAAQETQQRLTTILESTNDMVSIADPQGNLVYMNRAGKLMKGWPPDEDITQHAIDEFHPQPVYDRIAQEGIPTAIEEGIWSGETALLHEDGHEIPVLQTIMSHTSSRGEVLYLSTIIRDITDIQRAAEERERFTNQLRTAADVSAQVTTILDQQELLELVVPLISERFDLYHVHVYTLDSEAEQLVMRVGTGEAGRKMREEGHTIPLDQKQSLVARAARDRSTVRVDDVGQSPDFLSNPLLPDTKSEIAIPLTVGSRLVGVLDVQDDEPNRFTEGDINVFSTLAGQVAVALENARYFEEVQQTAERLREVDRLKSEFLANMSHELRTPLNSILGYTEVLLMGIDGDLTSDMEEDVKAIYENGGQLLRLINDILDLTKIEAGRMTLSMESVDVAPLLEDVKVNNLGLLHKRKTEVDIQISAAEDLPTIQADRVRLAQVLNNLVSNAVKFTDEGHVYLRASRTDDHICIEVEDTGVGIAEEDIDAIFERFRQVDGSSTRRAEGTGLGLAITQRLVQMHGGTITVQSALGKGSTFTVHLPIEQSQKSAQQNLAEV
jgi:PAS domain S-box-containing protein